MASPVAGPASAAVLPPLPPPPPPSPPPSLRLLPLLMLLRLLLVLRLLLLLLLLLLLCRYSLLRALKKTQNEKQSVVTGCAPRCIPHREAAAAQQQQRHSSSSSSNSSSSSSGGGGGDVLHIKPFILPVDIHHTQCPFRFFLLEIQALWSQNHDTGILHTTVVSRVDYGMTCRRSTGTAYKCKQSRFIGREINQRDKETTEKIRKKRNTIKIRGVVPPRRCSRQNKTAVRTRKQT